MISRTKLVHLTYTRPSKNEILKTENAKPITYPPSPNPINPISQNLCPQNWDTPRQRVHPRFLAGKRCLNQDARLLLRLLSAPGKRYFRPTQVCHYRGGNAAGPHGPLGPRLAASIPNYCLESKRFAENWSLGPFCNCSPSPSPPNPSSTNLLVQTTYAHKSGRNLNIQYTTCNILKYSVHWYRTFIRGPRPASLHIFHERPLPTYATVPPRHDERQNRTRASNILAAATVEQPCCGYNRRLNTWLKHFAKA